MGTRIIALAASSLVVLAVAAGISATSVRAGAEGYVPGRLAHRGSHRAGRTRSHVQARGDARHLPRAALQPGRSARRAAAGTPGTIRRRLPPTSCAPYGDPLSARRVRSN